ncbi:hypothetical protein FBY40_2821 [Microbacterium sp. SLBN-154]|nr:hypothetical protein FBY40_2821 [Microbacterium sp. SLBN-154]
MTGVRADGHGEGGRAGSPRGFLSQLSQLSGGGATI